MIVGLDVYEEEGVAELTIRVGKDEFVIQIHEEEGKIHLTLDSGHFVMDTLGSVVLDRGLEVLQ